MEDNGELRRHVRVRGRGVTSRIIGIVGRLARSGSGKRYVGADYKLDLAKNIDEWAALWMPYEDHIRELASLELLGTQYTAEDYAAALERVLGVKIRIRCFPEVSPGPGTAFVEYDEDSSLATIWYPERLSWWLAQYAIFHELSHLAAGHPFIPVSVESREQGDRRFVIRGMARKSPPKYEEQLPQAVVRYIAEKDMGMGDVYEAEAEVRARHNMLTSQLGEKALEVDGLDQIG